MSARARDPRTADLFGPAPDAPPGAARVRPRPLIGGEPPAPRPPAPQPQPVLRPALLWYAVVFPHLAAPATPAAGGAPAGAELERLARYAHTFTSWVSLEPPAALLLELRGSLRLFGPLADLVARIDATWAALDIDARGAVAPCARAALWLARAGRRTLLDAPGQLAAALGDLPLGCTGWDLERRRALARLGVTRLAEVARLPRAGLARRFGKGLLRDLDQAFGRCAEPRRAHLPRERFRQRLDPETEIEHAAGLAWAIEPLLERCADFLRHRRAGTQRLQLRLAHRGLPATRVFVGLASVTSDRQRMRRVLIERLERLDLKAPVRAIELCAGVLLPLPGESLDVFAAAGTSAAAGDAAPELIERLRARLGEAAVYGLRAVADHRPESAWQRAAPVAAHARRVPCGERADRSGHAGPGGAPAAVEVPRPVWLLAEPEPVSAPLADASNRGAFVLERGPERIESGWWDGRDVARDYYVARRGGARCWIFQERRTRHWYLHGVFA